MTKRKALRMFRLERVLSQAEFAESIGYSRAQYALIENGQRNGSGTFWNNLKNAYNLTAVEMCKLQYDETDSEN